MNTEPHLEIPEKLVLEEESAEELVSEEGITETDISPEFAEKLLVRLEICPKCQYERTPADDGLTSGYECPKCGVIYALALEEIDRRNRGLEAQDMAEAKEQPAQNSQPVEGISMGGGIYVVRDEKPRWVYAVGACVAVALLVYLLW
ncbi:MAG: hypothetical protein GX055_09785 [Desulfovibrionales bacterium]|nr:hypothetical protein [Desulfovibrionales bacterium]